MKCNSRHKHKYCFPKILKPKDQLIDVKWKQSLKKLLRFNQVMNKRIPDLNVLGLRMLYRILGDFDCTSVDTIDHRDTLINLIIH